MTPDELRAKVARIKTFRKAPLRPTGRFPERRYPDAPDTGPLMEANYARLIARGEGQAWIADDVSRLTVRVKRLRR